MLLTPQKSVVSFTLVSTQGAHQESDLAGKRYGEVLLVEVGDSGPQATVYNSFPLNDCPAELWSGLDPQAIATEHGAAAALLNGPRYWLMNGIEKQAEGAQERMTFGGIEMIRQATVQLSSMNPAPYTVNEVTRNTVFVFNAAKRSTSSSIPTEAAGSCRPGARSQTPTCHGPTCPGWPAGSSFPRDGAISRACSPRHCGWTRPLAPPASRRTT
jgi:hypothetical protein